MPRLPVGVTYRVPNPGLLPPWASMPVVLLEELARRGLAEEVEKRITIERKAGGHGTLEVLVFLVAFFACGLKCGLRPFWEKMAAWGRARGRGSQPSVQAQLAGLVGKTTMCSSTSLSRALADVSATSVRASHDWLLIDVPDLIPLLQHPAVLMRDTFGRGYHVFDMDPTVTGLCLRAIPPATEDLREGRRLTRDIAEPGYPGRKRADTQFIRAVVSHAGLGAWVHSHLVPGNGNSRADLAAALDAIKALMARLEVPIEFSVTRLDGAYGGVPAMTALIERGLPFVTRASQQLLTLSEVQQRLSDAAWEFVPGAEIEGMRSVAELGKITLQPAEGTLKDDGSSYAPITVRAVVTRLQQSGEAGRGVVVEGWQYEVFLTVLEPAAFPAAEVVSTYHGRSTCENRYAQEDQELGLDRVFSFQPGGQELATVVGMMVWNMQIARGFRMSPPPVEEPPVRPRVAALDHRKSVFSAGEDGPSTTAPEASEAASLGDLLIPNPVLDHQLDTTLRPTNAEVREAIREELQRLGWPEMLENRPGWVWDTANGRLLCPDGQQLHLMTVRCGERAKGNAAAYFATKAGSCRDCPVRDECFRSTTGKQYKQINVTVPADVGARLRTLLKALPRAMRDQPANPQPPRPAGPRQPSPQRGGHILHPLEPRPTPGPSAILHPPFLPAEARKAFRNLADQTQFEISLDVPTARGPKRHPLIAATAREKRHRRTSWTERRSFHNLPRDARVQVIAVVGRDMAAKLFGRRVPRADVAHQLENNQC